MIETIPIGSLLATRVRKKRGRTIYRVLRLDQEMQNIVLLFVGPSTPKKSRMPKVYPLNFINRYNLRLIPECIAPSIIFEPDESISTKYLNKRDEHWALLAPLLLDNEYRLFNKEERSKLIKSHSLTQGISIPKIYLLLTRYWWFGCTKNSFLPTTALRGKRGTRVGGSVKKGRPSVAKGTYLDSKNVNSTDLSRFLKGLKRYWVGQNLSLSQTYKNICDELYIYSKVLPGGEKLTKRVAAEHIPNIRQFRYHCKKLIEEHSLLIKRIAPNEWEQKYAARTGSAADIAAGPGDIYDVDGTTFDVHIVPSFDPDRPPSIGKMTVLFSVDRSSGAIVGFYDTLESENWNTYHQLLFVSFSEKNQFLKDCGFDDEKLGDWPIHGFCNGVFADRGPMASEAGRTALASRLRLRKITAPSERGDLKGTVERVNGIIQSKLSSLPGGYSQLKDEHNRERKRLAVSNAAHTRKEIRKFIAEAVIEYNKTTNLEHHLTAAMQKAKVEPTPEAIFRWGIVNMTGTYLRAVNPAAVYKKLLRSQTRVLTRQGIQYNDAHFSSAKLLSSGLLHKKSSKDRQVEFYIDPFNPMRLHWSPNDYEWDTLSMSRADASRFSDISSEYEIELYMRQKTLREKTLSIKRIGRRTLKPNERNSISNALGKNVLNFPKPKRKIIDVVAREIESELERKENREKQDHLLHVSKGKSLSSEEQNVQVTSSAANEVEELSKNLFDKYLNSDDEK